MLDGTVGVTELIEASKIGDKERVRELLKIKAICDNADADGNAALGWATLNGHADVVEQLLKIETVSDNAHANDNIVLRLAATMGYADVVEQLQKAKTIYGNAHAKDNEALFWATMNGHADVVEQLLKIKTVSDKAHANDNIVLRLAAERGYAGIVEQLLKIKTVYDRAHVDDNRALYWAAKNGHTDVVVQLLSVKSVRDLFMQDKTKQIEIVGIILNGLIEKPPITAMEDEEYSLTREPTDNEKNVIKLLYELLPDLEMLKPEQRAIMNVYVTTISLTSLLLECIKQFEDLSLAEPNSSSSEAPTPGVFNLMARSSTVADDALSSPSSSVSLEYAASSSEIVPLGRKSKI